MQRGYAFIKRRAGILCLAVISPLSWAIDCEQQLAHAQNDIRVIHDDLVAVTSMAAYADSVKSRVKTVELLLEYSAYCVTEDSLQPETMKAWEDLRLVSTSLQSSARAGAFTTFEDWMETRKMDMDALESLVIHSPRATDAD